MSVQLDVLDDVLNTIRLNGTAYFQKAFAGNWGFETKATPYKKFHIIVQGDCWLRAPFLDELIALHSGDIVAFPHGSPYRLSAQPDSPCIVGDETSLNDRELFTQGDVWTTIVFGHIEFTQDFKHPLINLQ